MTDFAVSWTLSRQRFVDEISDLTSDQLNWKPYEGALSIGQMALHVAGVEVYFSTQLLDLPLNSQSDKIKHAATDGVVNEKPFPYPDAEITPASVAEALNFSKGLVEPLISSPPDRALTKELKSALGPIITGQGALARFAFHPAYHQGQAYTYKMSPTFPKA